MKSLKNQNKKSSLILFDADHTLYLIRAEKSYAKLFSFLSCQLDKPEKEIAEIFFKTRESFHASIDPAQKKISFWLSEIISDEKIIKKACDIFWRQIYTDLKPRKNLTRTIKKLSEKYDLMIFSDEFLPILRKKLASIFPEWQKYFIKLITPEKTKIMKPSKEYYIQALKNTSYSKILAIGDSWERDLKIAKRMNMKTILIKRPDIDTNAGKADYVIDEIEDILALEKKIFPC